VGLNYSQWNQVRRGYQAGLTVPELVSRYKVPTEMIESYLMQQGLIQPPKQRKRRNGNNDAVQPATDQE